MSLNNLPIAYDFHGDIPFTVPFARIKPQDIHLYLDLNTRIGKQTCGQNCNHCWFANYEKVYDKSFQKDEGVLIKKALETEGYKVFARYADSFSYNGDFMRIFGPAHNREFRQEEDYKPTDTMKKGDAWTSGRPLLEDNYQELLELAWASGYGTISITFHGLIDESLNLLAQQYYPIKGVLSGSECEEVVHRICAFNDSLREKQCEAAGFRVNIGITLGKHNHSRSSLLRYALYFNRLGVDTVRFNNFTDHGGRHPDLPLSREDVEQVYRDLKWLHENVHLKFQLAVSEDFGTFGIEAMGFPDHVGWCRAGRQLFTVIPADEKILRQNLDERHEKIGDVVACVNMFEPHLGILIRKTNLQDGSKTFSVEFNHQAIDAFTDKRLRGVYKNGCFSGELLEEMKMELTRQAQAARKIPIQRVPTTNPEQFIV